MIVGVKIFLLLCTGRDTGSEGKGLVKCGGVCHGDEKEKEVEGPSRTFYTFPECSR